MEAARSPWPALGALLVRDGSIAPEQLERALEEKRAHPTRRLGEILFEQGAATRAQIGRILAEQHELTYIELEEGVEGLEPLGWNDAWAALLVEHGADAEAGRVVRHDGVAVQVRSTDGERTI